MVCNGAEQQPLLGILGGMGPLATLDFLTKLTSLTPADCDQGHVPWLAVSQPGIPDRSRSIQAGSDAPAIYLANGVAYLASQGVRLIAVPCNTSHYWFDAMQAASPVPILHIADAAIADLMRSRVASGKVAVLATRGTIQGGIYGERLAGHGIETLRIDEPVQRLVDGVVTAVKQGEIGLAAAVMQTVADMLATAGVATVMLACTELPIAWQRISSRLSVIDTSLALARGCLRRLNYLPAESPVLGRGPRQDKCFTRLLVSG